MFSQRREIELFRSCQASICFNFLESNFCHYRFTTISSTSEKGKIYPKGKKREKDYLASLFHGVRLFQKCGKLQFKTSGSQDVCRSSSSKDVSEAFFNNLEKCMYDGKEPLCEYYTERKYLHLSLNKQALLRKAEADIEAAQDDNLKAVLEYTSVQKTFRESTIKSITNHSFESVGVSFPLDLIDVIYSSLLALNLTYHVVYYSLVEYISQDILPQR